MSHLTQSQFNAARIRTEEIIKNIRSRIEKLNSCYISYNYMI